MAENELEKFEIPFLKVKNLPNTINVYSFVTTGPLVLFKSGQPVCMTYNGYTVYKWFNDNNLMELLEHSFYASISDFPKGLYITDQDVGNKLYKFLETNKIEATAYEWLTLDDEIRKFKNQGKINYSSKVIMNYDKTYILSSDNAFTKDRLNFNLWLQTGVTEKFCIDFNEKAFYFKSENDAMNFKMAWG